MQGNILFKQDINLSNAEGDGLESELVTNLITILIAMLLFSLLIGLPCHSEKG